MKQHQIKFLNISIYALIFSILFILFPFQANSQLLMNRIYFPNVIDINYKGNTDKNSKILQISTESSVYGIQNLSKELIDTEFIKVDFSLFKIGLAVKYLSEDKSKVDWRFCLLNYNMFGITNNPFIADIGFVLLDYDRTDFNKLKSRWIQLKGGLGYNFIDKKGVLLSPILKMQIGLNSYLAGDSSQINLNEFTNKTFFGFNLYPRSDIILIINNFSIDVFAEYNITFDKPNLKIFDFGTYIEFNFYNTSKIVSGIIYNHFLIFSAYLNIKHQNISVSNVSQNINFVNFGLKYYLQL